MLCKSPYMLGGEVPIGCGQCLPCRINRRRQWMWRQYLEALTHEESSFVTMTYDDAHLPEGGNLSKKDAELWLKRFRRAIAPKRIRFYLCGEYGENTLRPHYHASIFGAGVKYVDQMYNAWKKCTMDNFHVYEFSELTAQYTSGYVVKKLTNSTDPRLNGKSPEFATMSNQPGIGSLGMKVIADTLKTEHGRQLLLSTGDVPKMLKLGKRSIPLGRYLISKLRSELGMTEDDITAAKMEISETRHVELQALFKDAGATTEDAKKKAYVESIHQRIINMESRAAVFRKRGTL